jgi:3-phenylpropionate/trans-cinnamate dioxygenase ferredoxin reductase subunit
MLGRPEPYTLLPYFYTDQYDLGMEYSGWAAQPNVDLVVRGDLAAREFIAFWVDEGRVLAGMNVNVWDVTDDIQALVRAGCAGQAVDPKRLADADVPLGEVLG